MNIENHSVRLREDKCKGCMNCIVFVRGKRPSQDIIELAQSRGIILLTTKLEMFSSCGLLFKNGLQGGRLK